MKLKARIEYLEGEILEVSASLDALGWIVGGDKIEAFPKFTKIKIYTLGNVEVYSCVVGAAKEDLETLKNLMLNLEEAKREVFKSLRPLEDSLSFFRHKLHCAENLLERNFV